MHIQRPNLTRHRIWLLQPLAAATVRPRLAQACAEAAGNSACP